MFGEELIILFLQFVFELLFQLLVWFPWDIFLWWRERKVPPEKRPSDGWLVPVGGLLFGGICGGISLAFLPTALLRHAGVRMANLIATPLICGAFARGIARRRVRRGQPSNATVHFWFSLAFSAAFLIIRFTWAQRPS